MATIVKDDTNNKRFVLLGAGFGQSKTSRPNPLFSVATTTTGSESEMVAVANSDGEILWMPSYRLSVISVDGVTCRELLSTPAGNS